MVRNIGEARIIKNAGNGSGILEKQTILDAEDMMGHGSILCRCILKPHSSIGSHFHNNEIEWYYVNRGKGNFIEGNGDITSIEAGQIGILGEDGCHGIQNTGTEDMEIFALVLNNQS